MKACIGTTLFFALCKLLTVRAAQPVPDILWITNGPDAHFGVVRSAAFSADSSRLASGASDSHAKVWSIPGGVLVQDVGHGQEEVIAVALSPDGSLLVTGSAEGAVRLWSVETGERLCGGRPQDTIVWSLAISSDGSLLATGRSKPSIGVGNMSCMPGGILLQGHGEDSDVFSVVFSPDGTRLASASSDGTARIWRLSDGTALHVLTGHSVLSTNEDEEVFNAVRSVDISPDGTLLATSGDDATIRLWRMADGVQLRVIPSTNCWVVKFSPDGQLLLTANLGPINVWRVSTGQLIASYPAANALPLAVAPNGKYFAYGRFDGSVVLAYMPLWIESITEADGKVTLHWQGGSGLYRVQARPDLNKGDWHFLGPPTTRTSFTHSAKSHLFYRVVSLPNP